ncbi:pentatricopeptide repeat-containing protein At3g14330 [Macadamia integrifolia]|uniref:pentatricopeptide repeat-containing protein At3g14330 n=1 Tax=Macadamia integrifolia TaxID=60698 RepID=UPI001C52A003|nr:pentatricopeptide repeat-containing protein At3g14330 [Macadamia integrifolia]
MMIPALSLPTTITVVSGPPTHKHKPPSLVSTNPISNLRSLLNSGKLDEALRLIENPPSNSCDTQPNLEIYSLLLHSCIARKSLEHGQRLHLQLLLSRDGARQDFLNNPTLKSKLITLYSVCGRIDEARRIFEDGLEAEHVPESVWVAMSIAYSRIGLFQESLLVYSKMLHRYIRPGNFAFSAALKGCSHLSELLIGRAIHAQILKSEESPDQVVNNALLRLYADCGTIQEAHQIFEEMGQRNIVSWNSLVAAFVCRDRLFESLDTFRRIQSKAIGFSWVTLTTILPVCARVTSLHCGQEIHAQIIKSTAQPDVPVLNSLMDMYAKCGAVNYCREVFEGMISRDLTSWNTMLMGYAINGCMTEAIDLFDEMIEMGFKPDGVTFIALLSGCSHVGLMVEGQRFFDRMETDYGVSPTIEHYACLVDLMGRSGRIKEALDIVKSMPMSPSSSIWGSLLNSCRIHGNIALGEVMAERLFEIEPNNPGNYVILSNMYAKVGRWKDVEFVREMMEKRGIKKETGCSWIQIKNRVQTFVAGGGIEFRNSEEYEKVWNELKKAMEEIGYVPDTGVVLHDVEEEIKAKWVCGHSERLAVMFGLIHTGSGVPIRVTKNLRVCTDCHTWIKITSKFSGRLIVLRDKNRFHHFKDGACSCKDYW